MSKKLINNYCLYYIPKDSSSLWDTLMVFFGENKVITSRKLVDNLVILFAHEEVVGYALLNFSTHAKIKANGTIFLPNKYLIDIINSCLDGYKCEVELLEKEDSGYVVGKIIDKKEDRKSFIYNVDIGNEQVDIQSTFDIPNSTLVVVAKVNTYLLPARMIKEYKTQSGILTKGRICTYEDLQIEISEKNSPILIMEDNLNVGQDFFIMEEKANA